MLQQALISLMPKKSYETITVENICSAADIGRSTFYSHYTDKDDLMRSGFEHLRTQLIDHQKDALLASERDKQGGLSFSLPMFEHARNHIDHYRAHIGNHGSTIALDVIRQLLLDLVRHDVASAAATKSKNGIPRDVTVQCVVGAHLAVLTWWLDSGAKLPPEEIDAMFRRLAADGIGLAAPR